MRLLFISITRSIFDAMTEMKSRSDCLAYFIKRREYSSRPMNTWFRLFHAGPAMPRFNVGVVMLYTFISYVAESNAHD